jgi:hypothetical protein
MDVRDNYRTHKTFCPKPHKLCPDIHTVCNKVHFLLFIFS